MSEASCTICSISEPIKPQNWLGEFYARIEAAKTKQDRIEACAWLLSQYGVFSGRPDIRNRLTSGV